MPIFLDLGKGKDRTQTGLSIKEMTNKIGLYLNLKCGLSKHNLKVNGRKVTMWENIFMIQKTTNMYSALKKTLKINKPQNCPVN